MIELLLAADGLLAAGELDRAERIYSQVAEADPRNAIAVVGLARVALERGDHALAIALARSALAIDQDDYAARRVLVEIEELIAKRNSAAAISEPSSSSEAATDGLETPRARRSRLDQILGWLRLR